jgi:hypothetical protein
MSSGRSSRSAGSLLGGFGWGTQDEFGLSADPTMSYRTGFPGRVDSRAELGDSRLRQLIDHDARDALAR